MRGNSSQVITRVTLINGKATSSLSPDDRGFQFGDGLFETIAVRQGRACFLKRHMQRLQQGCSILSINGINFDDLSATIQQQAVQHEQAVIKLIITAGDSSRGYRRSSTSTPTVVIKISVMPEVDADQPLKIMLCDTRLARQPRLAGIKHLNRLEQVLARQEWDDDAIQEGLLLDTENCLIEATASNLFLVRDGKLLTPDLTNCGVAGVMRAVVIDCARTAGLETSLMSLNLDDLKTADEVFLTNALFGIRPVYEIIGHGDYKTGPVTRLLQKKLAACVKQDKADNWYAV